MVPTNNASARQSNVLDRVPPSVRTPRFVFGSTAPSSSASQFAATPRFRFPESEAQVSDVDADLSDVAPSSSALTEAERQTENLPYQYAREDVIQDSNSDEEELLFQDDPTASPFEPYTQIGDAEGGYDIDAEIDSIFPPTPERRKAKRRRVSYSAPKNPTEDPISSCPSPSAASPSSPSSPTRSPASYFAAPPTPSRQVTSPEPATPLPPSNTTFNCLPSSSTNPRRFLLHATSSTPISMHFSQSPQARPTTAPTSTQRRQPHFILPPTPSRPSENPHNSQPVDQGFAVPGRPRRSTSTTTTTPNCIPGGMAASVRGWLLEAEAAKNASQFTTNTQANNTKGPRAMQMRPPKQPNNYHLITTVVNVQHQSLHADGHTTYTTGHPAPTTLITTIPINTPPPMATIDRSTGGTSTSTEPSSTIAGLQLPVLPATRKVLLFGAPISIPPSSVHTRSSSNTPTRIPRLNESSVLNPAPPLSLSKGDKVGIRRGLVWEMELEEFGLMVASRRPKRGGGERERIEGLEDAATKPAGTRRRDVGIEKWVVGVEWDIL
ncbi:hypothetical protein ACJ72_01343 [Emergomyces africanus]|uniref:Uncharacterized protein n=1 Tax=Emergomyces africanus TaxID=1955775 RepID=A0A1B7P5L3_9EURO|nr:hypothetical protein ACJ72_01343 [Emergomyces africanus]